MKTLQERYNSFINDIESEIKLEINKLIDLHGIEIIYNSEIVKVLAIPNFFEIFTDDVEESIRIDYIDVNSIYSKSMLFYINNYFIQGHNSLTINSWVDLITRMNNYFKTGN